MKTPIHSNKFQIKMLVFTSGVRSVRRTGVGEISQHGLVTPRVAPSLEINLTTTNTLTPRRHSTTAFYFPPPQSVVVLAHGGLRHRQYFYQDGPCPGTRGLAVSLFVFFTFDQHVVPQ